MFKKISKCETIERLSRESNTYESIIGHNAFSLLLGFAVESAERGRQATGAQAVDVRLMLTPLYNIYNGN